MSSPSSATRHRRTLEANDYARTATKFIVAGATEAAQMPRASISFRAASIAFSRSDGLERACRPNRRDAVFRIGHAF